MTGRLPLLVIAGPTGVGKTAAAIALARRLPLEVVSADSRQVYRGMDVATGKPTAAERAAVTHHLIDIAAPDDRYSAARFRQDAAAAIAGIHARGRLPVVVGGTGLYIRALLRGLDGAAPADAAFRAELAGIAADRGRGALHDRLRQEAPAMARRLHPNDSVRVMRALERLRAGAPVGEEQRAWRDGEPAWDTVYVGLTMDREALGRRLRTRAAAMVEAGLAAEVGGLLARGYDADLPAMQSIGYREFAQVARGELSAAEALRLMQRDTVRYARRQWTWFTREPGIEWLDMKPEAGVEHAAAALETRLARGGVIG
jgi:tRNA dimethylallyltransferase